MGPRTQAAVKAFQEKYGLSTTGGVDAATMEVMQNPPDQSLAQIQAAKKAAAAATRAAKGTSKKVKRGSQKGAGAPTGAAGALKGTNTNIQGPGHLGSADLQAGRGMQSGQGDPAVKNLQIALSAAGIKVNADGRFGPQTEAAVRRLQQQHGLTVDGIVGPETKGLLVGLETGKQTAKAAAKAKTTTTKKKKDQPAVLRTRQPTPRHGSRTAGSRMKLTPPKPKAAKLKYSASGLPDPDLEETTNAYGYGGVRSLAIKDYRSEGEPLVDQDLWTRFQALADPPDETISDFRSEGDTPSAPGDETIKDYRSELTAALTEAIAARKAAQGGRAFARARAREQLLRSKLLEAGVYEEAKHARGRGGRWIEMLNKLKSLPVNKPQEIHGVPAMRLSTGHYAAAVQGTMVHDASPEKIAKAIDKHVSHKEELQAHGDKAMEGLSTDVARHFTREHALAGDDEGFPERHEMWHQVYDMDPKRYVREVFSQEMTPEHRAEAEKMLADAKTHVGRKQAEPYFDMTKPHELVPIEKLHPIKQDPSEHIAKAARYMDEAARGARSKRKPITGMRNSDGTVTILDGKGTLQASRDRGLTHLPVEITDRPESVELHNGEKVKVPQSDAQGDQIRRDALKYNSDYPESHAGILKGQPAVHVAISPSGPHGSSTRGWRASIRPVVIMPDGGHAAAGEPTVKPLRRFDGRRSGIEHAQRGKKYLGLKDSQVPIHFHDTETRKTVVDEPGKRVSTRRRATLGQAEGEKAAATRAEIMRKSPGAQAELARHQEIARGATQGDANAIPKATNRKGAPKTGGRGGLSTNYYKKEDGSVIAFDAPNTVIAHRMARNHTPTGKLQHLGWAWRSSSGEKRLNGGGQMVPEKPL